MERALHVCGACRISWDCECAHEHDHCPACGVELKGGRHALVVVVHRKAVITEAYLDRQMAAWLSHRHEFEELADYLTNTQAFYRLEPQEDLAVVKVPRGDARLERVYFREEGSFVAKRMDGVVAGLPSEMEGVILIRDGLDQLYSYPAIAALLLGQRAGMKGDA